MKNYFNGNNYKTEFAKAFISKNVYGAIILNLCVLSISFYTRNMTVMNGMKSYGVCHEFFYVFYFDITPKLLILISALPFVGTFCNEWNSGYAKFAASRMGIKKYLRSKVVLGIVGPFVVAFISQLIMTLLLQIHIPLTTEMGLDNLSGIYPFGNIAENAVLYQLIRIFCFSTFCSIWCCAGLMVSAFIPNRYVVYSVPFISFYLIEQIFNNKFVEKVPNLMSLIYLSTTSLTTPLFNNTLLDFLYINLLFIMIASIIGFGFVKKAGRRMRYE